MNIVTQQVTQYTLQEGQLSPNLWVPNDRPVAWHQFNLAGTITVSNLNAGTQTVQTTLWPVLNNLLGKLTWQGKPTDGSNGVNIKGIPMGFFWYLDWLYNANQPPSSGTVATLTATTYTVNLTVTVNLFDPRWATAAQDMAAYRGIRYGRPYWQLQHGVFNPSAGVTDPDLTSYVFTTAAATYTTALTVTYNVGYVTDFGMSKSDHCFDPSVEYPIVPQFGNSSGMGNNINFTEKQLQDMILLMNTTVATTTLAEAPTNNLGVIGGALIKTKFGAKPQSEFNPASLQGQDQRIWLANQTWPTGVWGVDLINRSLTGARKKTWLKNGDFYVDTNPGATPGGSASQSLRPFHLSHNLSAVAFNALYPVATLFGE